MKKGTAYLMTALLVAAISVFAAVASDTHHSAHVKISQNMIVGNTMVKKGDYKVRFDEVTGELTIKKMNGDLVATAIGHVIPLEADAKYTALTTTDTDRGHVLTAVQIDDVDKKLTLDVAVATEIIEQ
jgi:hypothetical protein